MSIFDHQSRADQIRHFYELLSKIQELQDLAGQYGIRDIFQDNGAKILQTLIVAGLDPITKRAGNDAHDATNEYELKTANINLVSGFSTHHHLNKGILSKYRKVLWVFSTYRDMDLEEIWVLPAKSLEHYFSKWEAKLDKVEHINNPKIPVSYVRKHGVQLLSKADLKKYKK